MSFSFFFVQMNDDLFYFVVEKLMLMLLLEITKINNLSQR